MADFPLLSESPFRPAGQVPLAPGKFRDPHRTAKGERRARVPLVALETLWLNTGTLCNLACATCYIESSPTNDTLAYLTVSEAAAYLDDIGRLGLPTRTIGLTGGEPFMNDDTPGIMADALGRGFAVLVLTNAMRPMRRFETELVALQRRFGDALTLRVSLDHHTRAVHEAERGAGSWGRAVDGLCWLAGHGVRLAIAGRQLPGESAAQARTGYAGLLKDLGLTLDPGDPERLVLFPGLDADADVPEISDGCWSILGKSPDEVMCASSRMVVKRRGKSPSVVACTLLPYADAFDLGATLAEAARPVDLNHPHCARFCVLGGASCGG